MSVSVDLVPLTEAEYAAWLPRQIAAYAEDKVRVGSWPQEGALERSQKEMAELLPDGLRTPAHRIANVTDKASGQVVGNLWIKVSTPVAGGQAFIYNIETYEGHRGRGVRRRGAERGRASPGRGRRHAAGAARLRVQ